MTGKLTAYPTMNESGVSWLGAIPAHWGTAKLKNLSRPGYKTFTDGDWVESPYIASEGIRLIQTGNIGVGAYREKGFRYISTETFVKLRCTDFSPNDILICRLGDPVGRSCLAPDLGVRMITSVDVCILKPRLDVCAAFLVYVMSSRRYLDWVGSLVRGSTRDRVSRSMLGGFALPLPPLPEQEAIVRYLDYMDRRIRRHIRAKQKLIKLLDEQKQAIIHRRVTRGLDSNSQLKPSGIEWLGNIPSRWEVRRAKSLFREVDRRSTTGSEVLLSLRMYQGLVPHNEVATTPIPAKKLIGFKKVAPGQIVMNRMRAAIGLFGVAGQPGIVSPDYAVFDTMEEINADFFLYLFKTPAARAVFRQESKGLGTGESGFMRLYTDRFGNIQLPVPSPTEQAEIVESIKYEVSATEKAITRTSVELALLQEFRTRLIADIATGKLDVRGAAANLPDEIGQEDTKLDAVEPFGEDGLDDDDSSLEMSLEEVEA
jgi:type I restriction enzyme S subunit